MRSTTIVYRRIAARTAHAARSNASRGFSSAAVYAQKAGTQFIGAAGLLGAATAVVGAKQLLAATPALAAGEYTMDYTKIKNTIIDKIEDEDEKRGDGSSIAGTLVRLAWHTSGTYSAVDGTGGSVGACMRMSPEKDWAANAGLGIARDFMEEVSLQYPNASRSDLWTLGGVAAIEYMGGPRIEWYPGRPDYYKPTEVPDGRLPDADKGSVGATIQHIRDIFGRMGFSDREMVALIGAHAVGRCHTEASGYWGPWTNAEATFSNEYFRLLLEEKWTLKKTHEGQKWTGPDQFEDPSGQLMMLPSDMALIWDKDFRALVELYAADEELFFKDFADAFAKLISNGTTAHRAGLLDMILKVIGLR